MLSGRAAGMLSGRNAGMRRSALAAVTGFVTRADSLREAAVEKLTRQHFAKALQDADEACELDPHYDDRREIKVQDHPHVRWQPGRST